jgi:hypothetical protein
MASSTNFQSAEYFKNKIDKKADDIFEAKAGKPQLQVNRLFRTGDLDQAKRFKIVRNQDVEDDSQIRALEQVQTHISP